MRVEAQPAEPFPGQPPASLPRPGRAGRGLLFRAGERRPRRHIPSRRPPAARSHHEHRRLPHRQPAGEDDVQRQGLQVRLRLAPGAPNAAPAPAAQPHPLPASTSPEPQSLPCPRRPPGACDASRLPPAARPGPAPLCLPSPGCGRPCMPHTGCPQALCPHCPAALGPSGGGLTPHSHLAPLGGSN